MDYVQVVRDFVAIVVTAFLSNILGPFLAAILLLIIGIRVLSIVRRIALSLGRRAGLKAALLDLLGASMTGIGWMLMAVAVLEIFHLDSVALALGGSLSLVALGVATAASGNLGDIIAGIFLASDPDFGNGFTIRSGEILGTIEHIDLRKTRVRTEDGRLHIIPNKQIENNVWIVEGRPAESAVIAKPVFQIPAFFRRGRRPNEPQGGTPPAANPNPVHPTS